MNHDKLDELLPITVLILTKNEAKAIEECIKSVENFDQIIVVDSGSTDNTRIIANSLGAQVIDFAWNGKYPKKKQWSLELADIENDWVLALTGYQPDINFLSHLGLIFDNPMNCKPLFNEISLETTMKGVYIAGVVCGGMETSKLFIENTRDHAEKIVSVS